MLSARVIAEVAANDGVCCRHQPVIPRCRRHTDARFTVSDLPAHGTLGAADLEPFDAVIILGQQVPAEALPRDCRLGLIARMGVGYDNVDVAACNRAAVALTIAPGGVRRPMALTNLTFILALAHRLPDKNRIARGGAPAWPQRMAYHGVGLDGRTLGSVGLGNIGSELFRIAAPLNMRFIAHDPYADPEHAAALGVTLVDKDILFRESDFVCLNCMLSDETRHIADTRTIGLMKPTAFLINGSRGPVVDQKALYDALKERRIAGAGLDVFDPEPPDPADPILKLDNVILAPHALGWTDHMFRGFGEINCAAVRSFREGHVPQNLVNVGVADDPQFLARLASWRQRA
jgi:phosphoglycerate dehydrogenase-like enzyme